MEIKNQYAFERMQASKLPMIVNVCKKDVDFSIYGFNVLLNDANELQVGVFGGTAAVINALRANLYLGSTFHVYNAERQNVNEEVNPADARLEKGIEMFSFTREAKHHFNFIKTSINEEPALIVYDDEIAANGYLALHEQPAHQIARLLRQAPYGLPILKEWEQPIFEAMKHEKQLSCFDNVSLDKYDFIQAGIITAQPDDVFKLVDQLIKAGTLPLDTRRGDGSAINQLETLDDYLKNHQDMLLKQVQQVFHPLYDPQHDVPQPALFDNLKIKLFPYQQHVVAALHRALQVQKSIILQGEMSTGKTFLMTSIANAVASHQGQHGYRVAVMVPPTLNLQWAEEVKKIVTDAETFVIKSTDQLIRLFDRLHKEKPTHPQFFIFSYTVLRNGYPTMPAFNKLNPTNVKGHDQFVDVLEENINWEHDNDKPRVRFTEWPTCPDCGYPLGKISKKSRRTDPSTQQRYEARLVIPFHASSLKRMTTQNRKCQHCGSIVFMPNVLHKRQGFSDWNTNVQTPLVQALLSDDEFKADSLLLQEHSKKPLVNLAPHTRPMNRLAAIDFIKKRMQHFFDVAIVDEVHSMKAGNSSQGIALGQLVASVPKVIAGTGTLLGGFASDVFNLLFRLNPTQMIEQGFKCNDENKFEKQYGNMQETTYVSDNENYDYKKMSKGKEEADQIKRVPGISPFVFSRFLMNNSVTVRLKEVWENPVKLVNNPTILVPLSSQQKQLYDQMDSTFQTAIANAGASWRRKGMLTLQYLRTGISMPDNMQTYPDVSVPDKDSDTGREIIWKNPRTLPATVITPKEQKLIDIYKHEQAEKRPMIVYITDTGNSDSDRDVQPRLAKVLTDAGATVAVLRANTVANNKRSDWLKNKVENEGVDVIILSLELVKVGLNLTYTPTIVFYQFSWSLFSINQAARRHWRIGQTRECRTYYLAYQDTLQESMATVIAKKNQATEMMNGDVSSDGLAQMLGEDGDLTSLLLKQVKLKHSKADRTLFMSTDAQADLLKPKPIQPTELQQAGKGGTPTKVKPVTTETNNFSQQRKTKPVFQDTRDDLFSVAAKVGESLDLFALETGNSANEAPVKPTPTTPAKRHTSKDSDESTVLTKVHHRTSKHDKVLEGQFELF